MVHHAGIYDCKNTAPDRPLNQPFDCYEESSGCILISTYSRNFTMPAWLMEKANAGWPFGAGVSKYWVC